MRMVDNQIRQLWENEQILPHRVVLAGFSQGAALALFCALNLPYTVGGVCSLSGWLEFSAEYPVNYTEWGSKRELQFLLMHGKQDKIAPVFLHSCAEELLKAAGFGVKSNLFDMEHTFQQAQGVHIRRWLLDVLPRNMRVAPQQQDSSKENQLHHENRPLDAMRAGSAVTAQSAPFGAVLVHGDAAWARAASATAHGSRHSRTDSQNGYAALDLVKVSAAIPRAVSLLECGLEPQAAHCPPRAALPAAFKASRGRWVSEVFDDSPAGTQAASRGSTAALWGLDHVGTPVVHGSMPSTTASDSTYKARHQAGALRDSISAASTYSGRHIALGDAQGRGTSSPLTLAASSSLRRSPGALHHRHRSPGMSGVHAPAHGREADVRALMGTAGSFSSLHIEAAGLDGQAHHSDGHPAAGSTLAWPMPQPKRQSRTALRQKHSHWATAGPRNGPSDAGMVFGDRAATPGTLHNQQMMDQWGLSADLMPGASRGSTMTRTPVSGAGSRRSRRSSSGNPHSGGLSGSNLWA